MPLMSDIIKSHRGGTCSGWSVSPLPATTTKSKPFFRKSRKRTLLTNFIFGNFFGVALSTSLVFLLITFLLCGIPKPIFSSHFKSKSTFHFPRQRKAINWKQHNNSEKTFSTEPWAAVDLTTKDLYDKIEFLDVDGGAWKQGWEVKYDGNEWDNEKLKIFVVPHSHNDPGWKLTVEEYYDSQSRYILDTIVEALSKDVRRKFIWEEMSYLERWWRDASKEKRMSFTNLVKNGQLEIVGGGWVMNDEANSHYFSIIDQITEGNLWLKDTIGVVPKNSWAIDPFGYSPTMAYIFRRMGFKNMLIQRTHYEVKKELALRKNLEYVWRQSWDVDETTDIFVHMMPFYSYDIPHTCGPDPAVCCQFDFARATGFRYEFCPWGRNPLETDQNNLQERVQQLLDQYRKKSTLYRTNTLLVPLGDDFRYVSIDEAEAQFRNYQMLFDYINSNASLKAEAKFGTLDDYFQTLRGEADRLNYSALGEIGSPQIMGFPSLSGDFFTYSDRKQDYWSGYYVSRPFFKAVDRVLEQTLRATELMMSLLIGYCHQLRCEKLVTFSAHKIIAARRTLALFQHHDGVTGTARDHVVRDYGTQMHISLQDLQTFMSKAIEVLVGARHEKSNPSPSQFEAQQVRSRYDAQPMTRAIAVHSGTSQPVVFFNPLEQTREEIVMAVIRNPNVCVLDSNYSCVESQISPEVRHYESEIFAKRRHRVYWKASIPALGLQTYYIADGFVGCKKAKPAKIRYLSPSQSFSCPVPYHCVEAKEGDPTEIQNGYQTLTFDPYSGLLLSVTTSHDDAMGSRFVLGEELGIYSSSESGAYLFIPIGNAEPIIKNHGYWVIFEGELVQEAFSYPKTEWMKTPVSHSTRIYNGDGIQKFIIEKEYHVELVGQDFTDKELIVRYKTKLDNRRIFYSDLNGFQMSRRETYDKIPLQGNYYPMPSLAFLQGSNGHRFSVHSRQSLGVASLKDGWLEVMLDRRLANDDGRGLGQGVMDNHPLNILFHLLLEHSNTSFPLMDDTSIPRSPSLLSHLVGFHLNYPLNAFIGKKPQALSSQRQHLRPFSPLANNAFPCDLHIVNLKVVRPSKYFSQLAAAGSRLALVLRRTVWDPSYHVWDGSSQCKIVADDPEVRLSTMFNGLIVSNIIPTSLNLLHEGLEMLGYAETSADAIEKGHVFIAPMEIQAYKFELQHRITGHGSMFNGLTVSNIIPTLFNFSHESLKMFRFAVTSADAIEKRNVFIAPMEIQAYKFELQPVRS